MSQADQPQPLSESARVARFEEYLRENARIVAAWPEWMREGAWTTPAEDDDAD